MKGVLLALLVLTGCDQSANHREPVGRYQMVASNNERHEVYVLDTQTGDIWVCNGEPNLPLTVGCGVPKGRPH